jgi:transcriptional regulator with XRE-family HTH domain
MSITHPKVNYNGFSPRGEKFGNIAQMEGCMLFVDRVTFLVNKSGITKNKMLSELNINHNAFAKWKNPNCIPNGETLSKLAAYFNVSTDYLLGIDKPAVPEGEQPDREVIIRAMRVCGDLNDDEYQEVLKFADYVKSQRKQ